MPDVPRLEEKKKEVVQNQAQKKGEANRTLFLRGTLIHSYDFDQTLQDATSTSTQSSGEKRKLESPPPPAEDAKEKKKS
jgi:hypothetical protein